jgi:hypothetical protein
LSRRWLNRGGALRLHAKPELLDLSFGQGNGNFGRLGDAGRGRSGFRQLRSKIAGSLIGFVADFIGRHGLTLGTNFCFCSFSRAVGELG